MMGQGTWLAEEQPMQPGGRARAWLERPWISQRHSERDGPILFSEQTRVVARRKYVFKSLPRRLSYATAARTSNVPPTLEDKCREVWRIGIVAHVACLPMAMAGHI